jgi:predicted LPLAT superfamily acyltransferase
MSEWQGKTRGNLLGYRIFVAFIRFFGLPGAYILLRIVSLHFYIFAFKPKLAMLDFYTNGMGFSWLKARLLTRQNFYLIGQTLVDRFAFMVNKADLLQYKMDGDHFLKQMADENKGGILISAHLGNWEIAGNMLKGINKAINVVMFDAEIEQIKKYLQQKTGGPAFNVIGIKDDLSHIFLIRQALEKGEFVCIHADRFIPGQRTITLDFLNKPAKFPYGPFHIASKFNSPVTFVFSVKDGNYLYQFSATPPMPGLQAPEAYAKAFVKVLEEKVKRYPEQWFNYYNFFKA